MLVAWITKMLGSQATEPERDNLPIYGYFLMVPVVASVLEATLITSFKTNLSE